VNFVELSAQSRKVMRTRFPSGGTRSAHDRNIRSVWVQEFEAVDLHGQRARLLAGR
jgi:hypothetical protein